MVAKIVGKETVDYVSKKTNNRVEGMKFHILSSNPGVQGKQAESVYISKQAAFYADVSGLPLESEVELYFNRWGNVDGMRSVSEKGVK